MIEPGSRTPDAEWYREQSGASTCMSLAGDSLRIRYGIRSCKPTGWELSRLAFCPASMHTTLRAITGLYAYPPITLRVCTLLMEDTRLPISRNVIKFAGSLPIGFHALPIDHQASHEQTGHCSSIVRARYFAYALESARVLPYRNQSIPSIPRPSCHPPLFSPLCKVTRGRADK